MQSETLIGAWVAARKNRDELVIATKYTFGYQHHRQDIKLKVSYAGIAYPHAPGTDVQRRSTTRATTERV